MAPPFWVSNFKIKIKTLTLIESQHSGLSNVANILILMLHFDAQNGGAPNSLIIAISKDAHPIPGLTLQAL